MSSFRKTKSTETSESVFAKRIEQNKKTTYDLELMKIVDCFLDGYGKYTSNFYNETFRIPNFRTPKWSVNVNW